MPIRRILVLLAIFAFATHAADTKTKIVLAGDSTVTDSAGWGKGFADVLTDEAICINHAAGGRSSKSFRDEGRWDKVIAEKPDVVLIQFGHNDQPGKGPKRETDPATTYTVNMGRYVDEARAAGATPVIVTSLSRRFWSDDGKTIESNLFGYVNAAKAVAKNKNVPLIELHDYSIKQYNLLGQEGCLTISPRYKDGRLDTSHLNPKGAKIFGPFVARELARLLPTLAQIVK